MGHVLNQNPMLLEWLGDRAALFRASSERDGCGGSHVIFKAVPIVRYTTCGAWIGYDIGPKRFVNLRAGKQWASANMAEAVAQLRARKVAQIRILRSRLDDAEDALALLDNPTHVLD